MYSIGVDIGGSHITCCMYEHSNSKLHKEAFASTKVDSKGSKEDILQTWTRTVSKTIELAQVEIEGIGIAMPGPFDYFNGISLINEVDKLEALYGVSVRKELAKRLNLNPSKIRFINDATAFSIAEAMVGKAVNTRRSVAITLGTGLGSSFLKEGQPIVNDKNVPAGGFLYNKYYEGILADEVFSTRGIIGKYKEFSGDNVKNVRELYERVEIDKNARKVFHWFGIELGKFLAPFIREFNTEVLVIGGNIAKAYAFFEKGLVQSFPEVKIYVSDLGEEAAIIGSALLLDDDYYRKLEPTLKLM